MADLFKRMNWNEFKNLDPQQYIDQQTIYIADKNLRVSTKVTSENGNFPIIYNGNYGFIEGITINTLRTIQNQLNAGIYVISDSNLNNGIVENAAQIYYFNGHNSWVPLGGTGGITEGTVLSVNDISPDDYGNVTITASNIKAIFTEGNIPITIQQWLENLTNQTATLINNHQWYDPQVYDGLASPTYTDFKRGNIQISGYFEGKMDGGGW